MTAEEQISKLQRENEELHRVLKSYDDVTNSLPGWIKIVVANAHPLAYNGEAREQLQERLKMWLEHIPEAENRLSDLEPDAIESDYMAAVDILAPTKRLNGQNISGAVHTLLEDVAELEATLQNERGEGVPPVPVLKKKKKQQWDPPPDIHIREQTYIDVLDTAGDRGLDAESLRVAASKRLRLQIYISKSTFQKDMYNLSHLRISRGMYNISGRHRAGN